MTAWSVYNSDHLAKKALTVHKELSGMDIIISQQILPLTDSQMTQILPLTITVRWRSHCPFSRLQYSIKQVINYVWNCKK